jgi:hypothetical protein
MDMAVSHEHSHCFLAGSWQVSSMAGFLASLEAPAMVGNCGVTVAALVTYVCQLEPWAHTPPKHWKTHNESFLYILFTTKTYVTSIVGCVVNLLVQAALLAPMRDASTNVKCFEPINYCP